MGLPLALQLHAEHCELVDKLDKAKQSAQDFFATYAAELRAPHYGDGAKLYAEGMLRRAEEAGLYKPPPKEGA